MNVAIVNPMPATANFTARAFLRPEVPCVGKDLRALQETNVVGIAAALCRRGHRVTVLCADVFLDGHSWTSPEGVRVEPVDTILHIPFHPGLAPATPALMKHPALQDADVIHTLEFHQPSTYFAALAARERSTPVVIWQETFRPMRFPGSAYQRAYESVLGPWVRSHMKRCVLRTTRARPYLRSIGVEEEDIGPWIPTGVDTDAYLPRKSVLSKQDFGWSDDDPVLLTVARLHPLKGVDLALQALARLREQHPTARLIVRGSGPEEGALRQLARNLQLQESVAFMPRVTRETMVDVYNLADVALCTSRIDLLPFFLLEAGACGRPSVATDVGAISDIVVDGETGVLVRDFRPEAVAEAVSTLLADGERRARMGVAARQRSESLFSMSVVASRFAEVYRDVAA